MQRTGLRDVSNKLDESLETICKSDVGMREVLQHLDDECNNACDTFVREETAWVNNEVASIPRSQTNTESAQVPGTLTETESDLIINHHIELSKLRCESSCSESAQSNWQYMLGFKAGLDKSSSDYLVK